MDVAAKSILQRAPPADLEKVSVFQAKIQFTGNIEE
jgi:hypothetical protein